MLETFAFQAARRAPARRGPARRERLALVGDRDRIARDLHDLVIQRLFATGMQLESAIQLLRAPRTRRRAHERVDELDATIRDIRSTIYALQTSARRTATAASGPGASIADRSTPGLGVTAVRTVHRAGRRPSSRRRWPTISWPSPARRCPTSRGTPAPRGWSWSVDCDGQRGGADGRRQRGRASPPTGRRSGLATCRSAPSCSEDRCRSAGSRAVAPGWSGGPRSATPSSEPGLGRGQVGPLPDRCSARVARTAAWVRRSMPELGEQVRDVVLHRLLGEEHPLADLAVGQPSPISSSTSRSCSRQGASRIARRRPPSHPLQHPLGRAGRVEQRLPGRDACGPRRRRSVPRICLST